MLNKNQNADEPNVILLNKAFIGSWNDKTGHISHEIIDFFRADNQNHYVYFSPSGKVNEDIGVINDDKNSKNTYKAQYLLLTSNATIKYKDGSVKKETEDDSDTTKKKPISSTFQIKYIIELDRLIDSKDKIEYGGKTPKKIFDDGDYPPATFVATAIYDTSAIEGNSITTTQFIYQRNRGYLYKDKAGKDFDSLNAKINNLIPKAKKLNINTIEDWKIKNNVKKAGRETFIDFINKKNDENIYSNILVEILKVDGIFEEFCKLAGIKGLAGEQFNLTRERFVKLGKDKGRIDIYAESEKFGIFIENKILSDLNGIKFDAEGNKTSSQITLYKSWVEKHKKSYGILLVPDYRQDEIKKELELYSEDGLVKVLTYKQIAKLIADNQTILEKASTFKYAKYADDLEYIFKKHAHSDKLEKFATDFINAINNSL